MNTYNLSQIPRTGNLDSNLIFRQYKLHQMCKFMEIKNDNPKMTQKEICNEIGLSDRTIARYRKDINMQSPYRLNANKRQITSLKRQNPPLKRQENTENGSENDKKTPKIVENQRKKRPIRGGNINGQLSGKELIEQAFNTTLNE